MSDSGGSAKGNSSGDNSYDGSGDLGGINGSGLEANPTGGFVSSSPAQGYAPATDGTSGSLDSFLGNPTGSSSAGFDTSSLLDGVSPNDFTGAGGTNLAGSGPVGGDSGLPGAGGGTNTPFAFGTSSFGDPSTMGTVADYMGASGNSGAPTVGNTSLAGGATTIDNLLGATANSGAPSGASAASVAAPAGIAGIGDLTVNPSGIESGGGNAGAQTTAPTNGLPGLDTGRGTGGGGNGSSDTGGLLKSLGIGGTQNGLGVLAAGAGLLNNMINGNKDSAAVRALQGQASVNNARAGQIIDQGQAQNAGGQGDVATGRNIIGTGQGQLNKGTALQQYIATGTLPQGYEDQVQTAARDAKTAIISRYATMGQSTDPNQNSQLQMELAQVDAKLPAMREQLASQLATSGNQIVGAGNQTIGAGNQTIGTGGSEGTNLINSGLQAAGISSGIYQTLANLDSQTAQRQSQAIANFAAALNNTPRSLTINTKAA